MSFKQGFEWIVFNTPLALEEVTAPTLVEDNTIKLYSKDKAGVSALYFMDDAEVEHELTDGYPTGTGANTRVTFWTGTSTLSSDSALLWDSASNFLGIGGTTPATPLHIQPTSAANTELRVYSGGTNKAFLTLGSTAEIGVLGKTGAAGDISSVAAGHGEIALTSTSHLILAAKSASGIIKFTTGSTDTVKFQVGNAGQWGIGGATYGTSGQVFTSGGASAQPTWTTITSGLTQPEVLAKISLRA